MMVSGSRSNQDQDPQGAAMANDKKPKKAQPPKVHGASSRGSGLAGTLADTAKKAPLAPAKKKK
jgi:hypothetical protein